MDTDFTAPLLAWFETSGRKNLPWQENINPYRVWISEIMLQQTQVLTVIPYFHRFMEYFPNIKTLANAALDEVLHLWTGLGYYARARNLHRAAKIIHFELADQFPDSLESILALPGIGRSTAGAILSIAFHKPTPILDGNVKSVLCRYHAIAGYPGEKTVENALWELANNYTPNERSADYTQAIMDLGATVCTRSNPSCNRCPLNETCQAYLTDQTHLFPKAKSKPTLPIKKTSFLICLNEAGNILLEKRPANGIWGGLWGFPECHEEDISNFLIKRYGLKMTACHQDTPIRHTFSHYHLDISPLIIRVSEQLLIINDIETMWINLKAMPKIGLAAPVKKILEHYHMKNNTHDDTVIVKK